MNILSVRNLKKYYNTGENNMDVCYNKLFKLLIDKGMKKTEFAKEVGISANTLAKLSHNENVSMEIIVRICRKMNCTVDEIMDILPETMNDSLY